MVQDRNHLHVALGCRPVHCCSLIVVLSVWVSPAFQEHDSDLVPAFGSCIMQGRTAIIMTGAPLPRRAFSLIPASRSGNMKRTPACIIFIIPWHSSCSKNSAFFVRLSTPRAVQTVLSWSVLGARDLSARRILSFVSFSFPLQADCRPLGSTHTPPFSFPPCYLF